MDCEQIAREELVEKYLNGRLEASVERELQVHILECQDCLALLETCMEARNALASGERAGRPQAAWPSWFTSGRAVAAAGLAAVVIAGILVAVRIGVIPISGKKTEPRTNTGNGTVGNGTIAYYPEMATLSSTQQDAAIRAMNSQTLFYPPDLNDLRGKRATLLGGSTQIANTGAPSLRILEPVGEVTLDSRPLFRWQPLAARGVSYVVVVADANANPVLTSPSTKAAQWQPASPLQRGQVYQWQVTATLRDGRTLIAPSFPDPKAKFRIVDQATAHELEQFHKAHPDAHLVLGILYAQAGLLTQADRELADVPADHRDFELAQHLLHNIRELH